MAIYFDSWAIDLTAVLLTLLTTFYVYFTWTFNHWKKLGVPFIKPTLLVGNFGSWAFLKADVGRMFKEIYDKSKKHPFVGIWVFRRPAIVINSPDLIKLVLVKDFNHFADRSTHADRTHDPLGADNLFFGKNPHWKHMRIKLTHLFSSAKMKTMFQLMNEIGQDLEDCLERSGGKPIEMKETSAKFTTDVIATTAYGLKANTLRDEKAPFNIFRKKLLDFRWFRAVEFMSIFFMQWIAVILKSKVFEKDCEEWLRKVFWNTVKEREKTNENRSDLIGTLINLQTETIDDTNFRFSGDSLVAQAAVFFTAGNESSSTTMSFLLYELAMNPDIQDKLATEVLKVLGEHNNEITYENLQQLSYLDMCFKETLRKYPPLPFLDRECTIPYRIPGSNYVVPKGTIVYIPMMGLQQDPEYFDDPLSFKPERFDKENGKPVTPFTFIPFGEGPRICIGERYGSMQSRIGMAHIIRRFEVRKCALTKIPLTWQTLTLSPTSKTGIYLEFKPRKIIN